MEKSLPIKNESIIAVWSLQGLGGFIQVHDWTFSAEK